MANGTANRNPRSATDIIKAYKNNLFKFGRGAASTARKIIWDGTDAEYLGFFSTAVELEVLSSSVEDTAASTGADTVTIQGLDNDGLEQEETVSLTGTTPVTLTKLFKRVNRAFIVNTNDESEVTGPNHGNITIREKATPANIAAVILATYGQTLMCIYTIPENKWGKLIRLTAYPSGVANTITTVTAFVRSNTGRGNAWCIAGSGEFNALASGGEVALNDNAQFLGPGAEIIVCAQVNSGTPNVSANFQIKLEEL